MSKITFIIIILLTTIVMVTLLTVNKSSAYFEMAIFPTGTPDKSYYYYLTREGLLKAYYGERLDDNIHLDKDFLVRIDSEAELKLDQQEINILMNFAKNIADSGKYFANPGENDSCYILLKYKGVTYRSTYKYDPDSLVDKMMNRIIKYSPIPVHIYLWPDEGIG